jgi:transglutaminase-like putative cysteine protease
MKSLVFIFMLISSKIIGGDLHYPVNQIPEDMKKGMYAVIRFQEMRWDIQSKSSASIYFKQAITILNAKANDHAKIVVGYDKLRSIKSLKGIVYDANGKEIRKLKQSEIRDQSSFDGFSLYSDNRLKYSDLTQATYPYTVEFEYEVQLKYLYSGPDFFLYRDDEISAQKTSYIISYPADLKPRYKLINIKEPSFEKSKDGKDQMVWAFENVKPTKFERLSPDQEQIIPNIKASPVSFEYGGYEGRMDTWKEYGLWQAKLNEGRNNLTEEAKQKARELTKNATTPEEKTKILYEYLQNKTRYVSIQLGIGGLQPFEAKTVDQTGYGDCKALSNYMVSLLSEVGVKGYYTTIMAGRGEAEIDKDFPSHQGNHVIVAVPNKADTLWLECTSQTTPFNWMGSFTGDRYAMMVTEKGGVLVRTPSYPAEANVQTRSAKVILESTGNAKATVKTVYKGLQYENDGLNFHLDDQYDNQKKWIQENTQIPSFDLVKFSVKNNKAKIPSAEVETDLVLNRFASVSGKRIFLTPNLMNRSTYIPEKLESRKTNVVLRTPYMDIDTIRYQIPEEIYPEFLPEPVKFSSRFGEYEASFKIDQGSLLYVRRVKMKKGEFPAESYTELIDFYKNMNKADNTKIVFVTKT